jgi:hypothetical protein
MVCADLLASAHLSKVIIIVKGGAPVRQILFTLNDMEITGVIITRETYSLM